MRNCNMIVMPSSNTGTKARELAEQYPGRIANLLSPGDKKTPIGPYALDNGRYAVWARGKDWDEAEWRKLLDWAASLERKPEWALVPDLVSNAPGTIDEWYKYAGTVESYGFTTAFAVQDGLLPAHVPTRPWRGIKSGPQVIFVGGTTSWKRRTLWQWCNSFLRVHVGRINTRRWLWECCKAGAESVDGTGYFRGDQMQLRDLEEFLRRTSEGIDLPQMEMEFSV